MSNNVESYTHQISVSYTKNGFIQSSTKVFKFKLNLAISEKNFVTDYSDEIKAFTLPSRWSYYYDLTDGVANQGFHFADLVEEDEPEYFSTDVKFVFKDDPVLYLTQKIFSEETIDLDNFTQNYSIIAQRGVSFFEKTIELNSVTHFQDVFKINGTAIDSVQNTSNNYEFVKRDLIAGSKWKFGLYYNFNKSPFYSAGQNLLTPLKPQCHMISKSEFKPIETKAKKETTLLDGGYYATCHPDTNSELNIDSSQINSTIFKLSDTWYDYFSYIPQKSVDQFTSYKIKEIGHLYGVKSVKFHFDACVRVYAREASVLTTNPNPWSLKSPSSEECDDGSQDGWMKVSISKEFSIFDNMSDYISIQGLNDVLSGYFSSTPKTRANFYFNGSINTDKVY